MIQEGMVHAMPYCLTDGQRRYLKGKRAADCCLSALVLAILAIPLLLVASLQKLLSPGDPILFLQERIGQEGVPFRIIKFTTMQEAPTYCPRIRGWFARTLRRTSIDELPQLVNVLKGDMSLIGPRPLIPQEQPIQRMRIENGVYCVRPGMTGWAQINGRASLDDGAKLAFDLEYVQNVSLAFDWNIFKKSVGYILRQCDVEQPGQIPGKTEGEGKNGIDLCGSGAVPESAGADCQSY